MRRLTGPAWSQRTPPGLHAWRDGARGLRCKPAPAPATRPTLPTALPR